MHEDGWGAITNIDVSAQVVKQMTEKVAGKDGITFSVMNVLALHFSDKSFDCVIDKGTFDTICCGENSSNNMDKMLREISRVLKGGGKYIMVSVAPPDLRMPFLDKAKYEWAGIEQTTVPKQKADGIVHENPNDSGVYYIYIATKK